jgi:chromosome segregation ATPase
MDTARKFELKAKIEQKQDTIAALQQQIEAFERHKALLHEYIDGKRKKNPFSIEDLKTEVVNTTDYITQMKDIQLTIRASMDELRRQMDHAEFVRGEQHMYIYLQPKKKVEPSPGV